MAYGDYAALLPAETQYQDPGAYLAAGKAEGYKRASYLSSMDQFYAQLDESIRQFDKTFGLQEQQLGLQREELAWNREFGTRQLDIQEMLGIRGLDVQEKLGVGQLGVAQRGLSLQEQQASWERSFKESESRRSTDLMNRMLEMYESRGAASGQITTGVNTSLQDHPLYGFTGDVDWSSYDSPSGQGAGHSYPSYRNP